MSKTLENAIVDAESRPDIAFDTGHTVLITQIRNKLGKKECPKRRKSDKFRPPVNKQEYFSTLTFEQTSAFVQPGKVYK